MCVCVSDIAGDVGITMLHGLSCKKCQFYSIEIPYLNEITPMIEGTPACHKALPK